MLIDITWLYKNFLKEPPYTSNMFGGVKGQIANIWLAIFLLDCHSGVCIIHSAVVDHSFSYPG